MSENKKENIVPFCKDCNRDLELIQRLGDLESYICRNCNYWVHHIIGTDIWENITNDEKNN